MQVPSPLQPAALQPVKAESALGVAISVTTVPLTKLAVQVVPHVMPAGLLATVPVPPPIVETVSANIGMKVAVTEVACVRVTTHGPVPVHPPPVQPVKAEPAAGLAVSVMEVPLV